MKNGIITLGEALIDFIPTDATNMTYQKNPGGAPANVAVGVARLGARSTFLSKVGNDVLGKFLKETLMDYGVKTDHMYFTDETRTNIVFVTLDETGERSFEFYVNPSADQMLKAEEVDPSLFQDQKIFHFGSITLIREPVLTATKRAIELAKSNGLLISYDPNLRLGLWESEEKAKEQIMSVLDDVDVLKISEEELVFLTGEETIETGVQKLREQFKLPIVFVTLGEKGSYVFTKDGSKQVSALKVKVVDTTGAGDGFVSGMLYCLNEYDGNIADFSLEEAVKMAEFGSVTGGLAASSKGAMTALPTLKEAKEILMQK